nr:YihA family ribosome biogenesis GTP-binding protein [Nitrospinaceae bacterium]NIR53732.1 YihA family ribosome biogenesis GTP-binding protein [Nitrospinaceae bacterium]NIS84140.1 YihA family ribosome biogenesis GTP-binding protein [Nitrospinaceae bacterium]NIT80941.1 YihA family ribosome biogenesis GTP-binding protein [Nitrospinaceae bacterium]NIU43239.1 YihA family ribosome biogenesis GTP-binding protein [Nitrospinaceae bacterium]
WMDAYRIPYLVVATKADKVSRGARKKHVDKIRAAFLNPGDELVVYSSETQEGRKELWRRLRQRAESKKEGSGEGPAGESARPKRSPPR